MKVDMDPSQQNSKTERVFGWKSKILFWLSILIGWPVFLGALLLNFQYLNWGNKTLEDFERMKSFITRAEKAHVSLNVPIDSDQDSSGTGIKTSLLFGHRYRIVYLPQDLPKDIFGKFKNGAELKNTCILMEDTGAWTCVSDTRLKSMSTWEIVELKSDGTLLHGNILAPKGLGVSNKKGDIVLGQENMYANIDLPRAEKAFESPCLQLDDALPVEHVEGITPPPEVRPYLAVQNNQSSKREPRSDPKPTPKPTPKSRKSP